MSELIMTINVIVFEAQTLEGQYSRVVMIPFSAEATGKYFSGKTIANGIDTQITTKDGFSLSARYMLEGADFSGKQCRIFIENSGTSLDNCRPKIYTDNKELAFLEKAELAAKVECVEEGVVVRIYL